MRPIAPIVYNAKRVQEKPIPKMPLDNDSEHEYEIDLSSQDINVSNSNDSDGAGNSTTDREIDDERATSSNEAGNLTTDGEINDTSATNLTGAESTNSLLPIATVFLPEAAADDDIQSDDMVKHECVYEMNPIDEVFLNGVLEEGSDGEHEVENNTFEQSQNDIENGQQQNENAQQQNENENKSAQQQNENENENAQQQNKKKEKKDDAIVWLDEGKPFPLPSNATAGGLIKRENDPVSGSLPYYMKVNYYTKKS